MHLRLFALLGLPKAWSEPPSVNEVLFDYRYRLLRQSKPSSPRPVDERRWLQRATRAGRQRRHGVRLKMRAAVGSFEE